MAQEVTEAMCCSLNKSLVNVKTESFTTVNTTVKNALKEAVCRVLSPQKEIDVVREAAEHVQGNRAP